MNLSDITAWLASAQDFRQGAALYAALGASGVYKRLFALGATANSRLVLLRELRALVPEVHLEIAAVAGPAPESPAAPAPGPVPLPPTVPADSPVLTHLRKELKAVRDLRSHIHAQLTAKGMRRTERQEIASTIVALTAKEAEFLAAIAHVVQHGRLPGPVATADVTEAGELRRRLQNCLSLRSKLKKQPQRAADLAACEADILLIRSKLNP